MKTGLRATLADAIGTARVAERHYCDFLARGLSPSEAGNKACDIK